VPPLARAIWVLIFAASVLAACGSPGGSAGPGTFTASFEPIESGLNPVSVSLIDQAGVVTGIDLAPTDGTASASDVSGIPGKPMRLRISWLAGECTDRVSMVLNSVGGGYELAIHNHEGITAFSCTAAKTVHALSVAFNRVVEPAQLSLTVQYP
jgi:hypothetical protein